METDENYERLQGDGAGILNRELVSSTPEAIPRQGEKRGRNLSKGDHF